MDTIENQQGIYPNQNGKPKNKIELWKKFLVVIVILFMVAGSLAEVIKSISEDFFWKVFIKVLGPIAGFIGLVGFPTMGIFGLVQVYFSIIQDRTESLAHNNNQFAATPKPNWIVKFIPISMGLIIAILYLVLLFFYLIFSTIGGTYYSGTPSIFWPIRIFGLAILELIPFLITGSWASPAQKRIYILILSILVFTVLFVCDLLHT